MYILSKIWAPFWLFCGPKQYSFSLIPWAGSVSHTITQLHYESLTKSTSLRWACWYLKLSSWMFIQHRVIIEETVTPYLRACVCVWIVQCRWPSFFIQSESFLCGSADLTCCSSLFCKNTHIFCKLFLCETRHLMLLGCMLEYLKGKTHEQEEKPSVGFLRSLFFPKLIHIINSKWGSYSYSCIFYVFRVPAHFSFHNSTCFWTHINRVLILQSSLSTSFRHFILLRSSFGKGNLQKSQIPSTDGCSV